MRTLIIIVGGFVLLGVCLVVARWLGGAGRSWVVKGASYFLPLWLIAAGVNLWIGVAKAGYSLADEAPIFAVIFGIPAAAAAVLWWRFSRG